MAAMFADTQGLHRSRKFGRPGQPVAASLVISLVTAEAYAGYDIERRQHLSQGDNPSGGRTCSGRR
jgi:hypothetical protein